MAIEQYGIRMHDILTPRQGLYGQVQIVIMLQRLLNVDSSGYRVRMGDRVVHFVWTMKIVLGTRWQLQFPLC